MRIAIYGGGFNPPHLGHVEAARSVLAELRPDKLLILPDRQPPHKQVAEGSPAPEQRMELCRLAFGALEGAELSDLCLRREGADYTAETVSALREVYPEDELILSVGSDMFLSFEDWYRFEYLLKECSLAVLAREELIRDALRSHAEHLRQRYGARVLLLEHAALPMSSSEIRALLRRRMGEDMLPDAVYGRIIREGWYDALPNLSWLREKAYALLDERRIAHVAGCESEAVRLAMQWGEDPETAATAAILHDITKKFKGAEQLNLCEKYGIICDDAEKRNPKLLHARTGAAAAATLFGVSEQIAEAIRWHTTGKPDMSLLEKIVYLADYIEPTRDFPGVDALRALCREDLDAAMAAALELSLEEIRARGEEPYRDTVEAALWYAEKRRKTNAHT